ncbi:hypothetical protein LOD99_10628 [Oopsacas minuta]|uniref:NAD(P)(+)--arginine ADP-ribosyltransferase n=1 Tax=Oopsacas minuta TaxID=111878 RepID=A0AAV7KEW4_9METZ|nr:hypothetical protein LOD99_10628 [Oopsacas minuta]
MGNHFPGVAGDANNNCSYCALGYSLGWTGQGVFHTHDETTPEFFRDKEGKAQLAMEKEKEIIHKHVDAANENPEYFKDLENVIQFDPLTFLQKDIQIGQKEVSAANQSIQNFFNHSGIDPKKELQFDLVIALAKLSKYRIRERILIPKETDMMIEHAKRGNFNEALKILKNYPGIVNYIPAHRAWGLIHQAAYFNNYEAIENILQNPKCDPFLRTKLSRDGKVEPGTTAREIAKDVQVKELISKHQEDKTIELKRRSMETLVKIDSEKDIQVESILLMLNCFENVLYPKNLQSKASLLYSNLMLDIFDFINTGDRWEIGRKEISLQLQSLDISDACFLATGKVDGDILSGVTETKSSFYSRVIQLYTRECSINNSDYSSKFYTALNFSFLTHGCKASFITGEDLGLAAYGALLNSILMYWGKLIPTREPTYRGMSLKEEQIEKYEVGQPITWLCFSSSSLHHGMAETFGSVTFIFDNSHQTKYAAKSIKQASQFPGEEEFLYPSGAKFRITKIMKNKGEKPKIWMSLEEY